ncbi:MAG: SIS domain-containing protein [Chloroflexi bacterium]|nr:SIS domain-containing protein [Chloroflexota bacterium]
MPPSFRANSQVILAENARVLSLINEDDITKVLSLLQQAQHLFVVGSGRSRLVMQMFAMRLMHLGLTTFVVGETVTPALQPGDLLIACSASGETASTCLAAEAAVSLKAKLVTITATPASRLAQLADCVIWLPTPTKTTKTALVHSEQYAGSLFEQSALLMCDSLVLYAMRAWLLDETTLGRQHANLE